MKTATRRFVLALLLAAVILPPPALASYFDLIPSSRDAQEIVTYDARYPYWTKAIYISTYPHHSWSREGWEAEYYGGVQFNSAQHNTHLLWSTWQMHGKGAPASGIDFVHAGPRMGWHRSTWEGSSGGVSGSWPADEFTTNQWYRFVHRVWTPTDGAPHTGYAGVWMKNLKTGIWYHMATFKFPAELTGFNNMGGFMEWFGRTDDTRAGVEFRNSYSYCDGRWISQTNFSAINTKSTTIVVRAGEYHNGVYYETRENPLLPGAKSDRDREGSPVARQHWMLRQPAQPNFFDPVKIEGFSAQRLGRQVVVRWEVNEKADPQLGYDIEVLDGTQRVAAVSENAPEARQCVVTLPSAPAGEVEVVLKLRDIFNLASPEIRLAATTPEPLSPAKVNNPAPGLTYGYYQTNQPGDWTNLPDFAALKPARTGVTALPDITPRLRRQGYAFTFDGFVRAPASGLYTFNLTAASGAELSVDGRVMIDADGDRSIALYPGTIALQAGDHALHLEFYNGAGRSNQADDFLQLAWAGPGFPSTPVPADDFFHAATNHEPVLTAEARLDDGIRLELSSHFSGETGAVQRVEYYAINNHFDYFSQQGAQSENCFLTSAAPGQAVSAPIWGGGDKTIFARAILNGERTVDSEPVVVHAAPSGNAPDANGMKLTALEHHLYPMNHAVKNGIITLVGESVGLLTRPQSGDVTIIAHLAGITSDRPLADGTRLESPGNWYAGIILRDNLNARPGEPLGGRDIPFIALMGSADGATRRCDSTMINGAGNQPSGDIGRSEKWFKLTRQGPQLTAYLSKDGQTWRQVARIEQPKMKPEIQVGFVQYAIPSATPIIHWAEFDHLTILDHAE